jgi:heavy metal translocating P-type ATPase
LVKNTKEKRHCDLCGLDIDGKPIVKEFDGQEKFFCCEGCGQVYKAAYDNNMLDEVCPSPVIKPALIPSFILDSGETTYFSMGGMWCAGCATAAEQILLHQPGMKKADISFAAEKGRIQYDPDTIKPQEVLDKLSKLGYHAQVIGDQQEKQKNKQQEKTLIQLLVAIGFGMQIMILYLVQLYPLYAQGDFNSTDIRNIQYIVWVLATPVMFYGGNSFLRGAWRAIKSATATMDTLVALGTLSAYGYSTFITLTGNREVYFDSVVMITVFIMLGRYIESLGGSEARKDIHKLLNLRPKTAWKKEDDEWKHVKALALKPGDLILIKPGESVPADSVVISGEATINESMLTGESKPVAIKNSNHVYAGTVLYEGALNARVEKPLMTSRFTQIVDLVEQTLTSKPPIQRLADKVSVYFAFGILGISIITLLVRLFIGEGFSTAILTAIAILVVACPCALGLATPLALVVTLGQTTKAGLYVRNPGALETAAKINLVVFDKTGTVTQGKLSVEKIQVNPDMQISEDELLRRAAAVEQYSEHPIGKAIINACTEKIQDVEQFKSIKGLGASAKFNNLRILVGSSGFLSVDENSEIAKSAENYLSKGESVVWVGWDNKIGGLIVLSDQPNKTAVDALDQLSAMNIDTVLLSGDNPITTNAIAKTLNLSDFEGNCSPFEKSTRIKDWQETGMEVAMVGDGINDAPALAQANLSFTVAGGTDIAGETSDVVMIINDLSLVPWFIKRSKKTRRIILENLGWAFTYNLITVPLAAFGLISPVIAAVSMATSSLLVVGNSLRLRKS